VQQKSNKLGKKKKKKKFNKTVGGATAPPTTNVAPPLGSGLFKQNSVYDFGSCANYLVSEGYVHRDRLGAIGYSAGCLVVGALLICTRIYFVRLF
jgi:dienelactone hydrolase